nr:hypothetical protein [Tanacetum cinerariifolium]
MLVVLAGGDGADAATAGAAAANEVPPPPPPPDFLPTHTSSSTLGPSTAAHGIPVRDSIPMREPTPSPTTPFNTTTSTRPPSPSRQTSFQEDISDTIVEAAYTIYKDSHDAHASSDAGPDEDEDPDTTNMPFRRTKIKRRRLRKNFTSSAFKHFQENIFDVEDTISAGAGIPADAQTIPAGSTPIPTTRGVSAGSSMDPAGQAVAAAAPSSSAIPTADKGKALMVDDSIPADLLTEQERVLKNLHDYQLREDLAKKLNAEQEAEFARQQEELA